MTGLIVAFIIFFFLLAIGSPLFINLLLGAIVGLYIQIGFQGTWGYLSEGLHYILSIYVFAVIVMFILVGYLADSGGLGTRAYNAFHKLFGHIRGGVLVTTVFAAAAFGACSGATVASAALFSKIAFPEMKKYKYDEGISLGCIAAAGSLAILIPPSTIMVIYGVLTNVSIGKMLLAGILPGITIAIMLALQVYVQVRLKPQLAPTSLQKAPLKEQITTTLGIWPLGMVFGLIVFAIWTGLVTPSEAGAMGALIVLGWNLIVRTKFKYIKEAFRNTAVTSCQIISLIVAGLMLSKVVVYSGVSLAIVEWITVNNFSLFGVWVVIITTWLILGMIIDPTSLLVISVPLFFPVATNLGVDPIAFGIVAVVMVQVAVITPPVGFNCFVVASVAGVAPETVFKGIFPFFVTLMIGVLILILFPQLATILPDLAFG